MIPSDPLIHYFGGLLRERFGFGSAYLVFHKEEPIAAFKANRNATIDVTDFVGDSELEKEALRVMKEFAWEHQMPLTGDLYEKLDRADLVSLFANNLVKGFVILIMCLCSSGRRSNNTVAIRNIANRLASFLSIAIIEVEHIDLRTRIKPPVGIRILSHTIPAFLNTLRT